jgi:hypothetical protein
VDEKTFQLYSSNAQAYAERETARMAGVFSRTAVCLGTGTHRK